MNSPIDWAALAAPFEADELDWRIGRRSSAGDRATLLAYITTRAVMDRLDQVVGPHRWRDRYELIEAAGPDRGRVPGFLSTIEIEVAPGQWVAKSDASDLTDMEALKGGIAGAFKRAAVKWGVGRYLYGLDTGWHSIVEGWPPKGIRAVPCRIRDARTGPPGHIVVPRLPPHMLPPPAPDAHRERMVARIRELEVQLGVPARSLDRASRADLETYGRQLAAEVSP